MHQSERRRPATGKPWGPEIALGIALSTASMGASASALEPLRDPFLADSPNNQSRWNDAATDSTPAAVPTGHFCMTAGGYAIAYADTLGIPAYGAEVSGERVYWFFTGTSLTKLHLHDGQWIEVARQPIRVNLPGYRPLRSADREMQARTLALLLAERDEAGVAEFLEEQPNRMLQAVEDQVAQGVLYSLFTRDYGFIGASARGHLRIDNLDPSDPLSGLSAPLQVTLPELLFDNQRVAAGTIFPVDLVFGLGMTFNGYLVVSTLGGRIATLDRDNLTIVDIFEAPADELFTNGFATSAQLDGGAIYIASNHHMYRLAVDADGQLHSDEAHGAWAAAYDPGERLASGKIADGTGATPTLMGFGPGEDELVIITDGARQMRLVAFWRNQPPDGWSGDPAFPSSRIADQMTVDFGPEFEIVQSEQSVVADGGNAFVVNSVMAGGAGAALPARGSFIRGLLGGPVRPLPRGAAMYRWDQQAHRWEARWSRQDIGIVATVPMLSVGSDMVVVNGTHPSRPGSLLQMGLDVGTGELRMSIDTGTDPQFNGAFTGIKADDDGTLMYTTMFGLVRFDTGRMQPAPSPDVDSLARCPAFQP